jgi:hypothetical protein
VASTDPNRAAVTWSPRVPKHKLRRLYTRVAQGIWDEELIDDVGMTLYMRCRDILIIHRALHDKKVTCPRCLRDGNERLLGRGGRGDVIHCDACGWEMTWRAYHRAFKKRQLNPGGAVDAFETFMRDFAASHDARKKMLAIDRVVHEFHYSLKADPDRPTRAAGVNLIAGDLTDVVEFLDELGNMALPASMKEIHEAWQKNHDATYWPAILRERHGRSE